MPMYGYVPLRAYVLERILQIIININGCVVISMGMHTRVARMRAMWLRHTAVYDANIIHVRRRTGYLCCHRERWFIKHWKVTSYSVGHSHTHTRKLERVLMHECGCESYADYAQSVRIWRSSPHWIFRSDTRHQRRKLFPPRIELAVVANRQSYLVRIRMTYWLINP